MKKKIKKTATKLTKHSDDGFVYVLEYEAAPGHGWYVPCNDEGEKRVFSGDDWGLREIREHIKSQTACGDKNCPCPIHEDELKDSYRVAKYARIGIVEEDNGEG